MATNPDHNSAPYRREVRVPGMTPDEIEAVSATRDRGDPTRGFVRDEEPALSFQELLRRERVQRRIVLGGTACREEGDLCPDERVD